MNWNKGGVIWEGVEANLLNFRRVIHLLPEVKYLSKYRPTIQQTFCSILPSIQVPEQKMLVLLALLSLSLAAEIKIIGTEGIAPCALTCAGVTPPDTPWAPAEDRLGRATTVDITECGFTSTPVITVSISGTGDFLNSLVGGQAFVNDPKRTGFNILLVGFLDINGSDGMLGLFGDTFSVADRGWRVNWTANGYNC